MNLKNDLQKAINLIENSTENIFETIYPFCNENIKELFSKFDLNNKECLTVLSSSDQIFDMYLKGATNITSFDINGLTKYYYALKKACLLADLDKEEYLKYFCYEEYNNECKNKDSFNINTFNKIKNYLDKESYIFWTELYNLYNPEVLRKPLGLFNFDEDSNLVISNSIDYLQDDNFDKLKEIIKEKELVFYNMDLNLLPVYLDKKYDFIYLSNIIQYTDLEKFRIIIELLKHNLKEDGNIICGYLYCSDGRLLDDACLTFDSTYNFISVKSLYQIRKRIIDNIDFAYNDYALIYKKNKRTL